MTTLAEEGLIVAEAPPGGQPSPADAEARLCLDDLRTFDEWALARWPALVRFAWLTTGDRHEAQDVVQDALVAIYPRWRALHAAGTVEAYARRSIVNGSISRWRKFGHRETPGTELPEAATPRVPDVAATFSDADHARRLCHRLPPQQRAAVVLRFYEDLPFAEIGKILGCSDATARSHVHRALASLRALLEQGDSHD